MTDLSEGGKNRLVDVKAVRNEAEHISPEAWTDIRAAVIRDTDIAVEHGLKLSSGSFGIDAWLIV